MSNRRFIIEMGMGNDLHGRDYTKAACRAVKDALHGSSLAILKARPEFRDQLQVKVTIGVQEPDQVDRAAVLALLPVGKVSLDVVDGGLNVHEAVIAQASIEAFLPQQA